MKQLLSILSLMLFVAVGTTSCTQGNKPSSNEIWYTTTDNTKLFPKADASLYGAIPISNTYKDGQGILVFDDAVTMIGSYAFENCSSLTSITIPDGVTSIGWAAFENCSSLTSVTIPDGVTTIGKCAFRNCRSLTSITIPDSVTEIEEGAFLNCTSLTTVTIGNGVTSIGEYAFYKCSSLTSVTIPDSVTEIGYHTFEGCSSLTSIIIPDGVTEIGEEAFDDCSSLKEVYCKPTTPPSGGYYMFDDNASGRKIYVPTESVRAYKTADYWRWYADAIVVGYDF